MQPQASHPPDRLRFGHPDWVRSLSRGAGVVGWGMALGAAAGVAGEVTHSGAASLVCETAATAGGAAFLIGAWQLSSADPNGSTPATDAATRWVLRLTLIVAAAGAFVRFASGANLVPPGLVTPLFLAALAAAVVEVAGRLAFLRYAARVAMRVPDATLAGRLVSVVPAYGLALVAIGWVIRYFAPPT